MATDEKVTYVMSSEERMRKELADAVEENRKNPLDKTEPGGKYLGTDGEYHDAEGNKIGKGSRSKTLNVEEANATVKELEEQLAQAKQDAVRAAALAAEKPAEPPKKEKGK